MDLRLAAVDLDGTLLRNDLTISERTRAAIRAATTAGVEVIVVTARSPRSVREIARAAGVGGRAICANGATVFDLDRNRIVLHRPLKAEAVQRIVTAWRARRPDVVFGWELGLRFGSEPAYEALRDATSWPRPTGAFRPVDALEWGRPVTKLLARSPAVEIEELLDEARELARDEAGVTRAGSTFVELMAPGVSKEAALAALAERRRLAAAQVVAFGDQLADAGMLGWAGLGVAVANADPRALAAADVITLSNDEDGVAVVLERLLSRGATRQSARTRP